MYNYLDLEADRKRLSRILMLSRAEGRISQEKMALEFGVAKKTVQNWEHGISAPTLIQAIGWFRVLDIAALPYLLQYIFPELERVLKNEDEKAMRKALISIIDTLPIEGIKQLLFLFYGQHGSSPQAVMNLIAAHLSTPLRDRYSQASLILQNYELSLDENCDASKELPIADLALLKDALSRSRQAIIKNKDNYSRLRDD